MGVMSDLQVIDALEDGRVIIYPFDQSQLNTSSYDVRLGEFYYEEQRPSLLQRIKRLFGVKVVFNPYDKDHVDRVWGTGYQRAQTAREVLGGCSRWYHRGIHPDDLIILVGPRRTILAHTQEYIGGARYATSMMKARSSFGRSFIEVCKCAGWGDVGYWNRWTMEITNNSYWYSIPLVVGRRVAQIALLETGPIRAGDYSAEGKYQTSSDLSEVRFRWHPRQMLPQLWRDRDIQRDPARREILIPEDLSSQPLTKA